ncbi:hypothetical protein Barb6_02930 [Bacteroidales bacterium Barb6]|nr:hypothetical protein Barb6_02930 [Bacteroidales bacterium Barb6]
MSSTDTYTYSIRIPIRIRIRIPKGNNHNKPLTEFRTLLGVDSERPDAVAIVIEQGKRTKLSNQFFQILNVVSRIKPAFLKAKFIRVFLNDLQGRFSHCREIFSGMSFPCPAGIFSECYVQMPVLLIFNAPMTSDRVIETTCVHSLFIADAITDFLVFPVFNHP